MRHLRWSALYVYLLLCLVGTGVVWAQQDASHNGAAQGSTTVTTAVVASGGNPVLPPKWAFGVLYGSYHDQAQVLSDMKQLRENYNGDLYWIDSSWLSGNYNKEPARYICFQFDPQQFPDATVMISTLRQNHFHFGVWEWP